VAQSGSAFGWGPKGRWFKSSRPDYSERLACPRIDDFRAKSAFKAVLHGHRG
jgi:hypothetical protein